MQRSIHASIFTLSKQGMPFPQDNLLKYCLLFSGLCTQTALLLDNMMANTD